MSETAYIALGANLGDRRASIDRAIHRLDELGTVAARSGLWETAPVGVRDQPAFLNGAVALTTGVEPGALLDRLLRIERELGRDRATGQRWGPRIIDLDLLLYGARVIDIPGLSVPHPRMHERAFVLAPLAEIAPGLVHPVLQRTIVDLAHARGGSGITRLNDPMEARR